MKVEFTNPTNRYTILFFDHDNEWYDENTYEDINDALAVIEHEIDDRLQALGAHILNPDTGEIYASCYYEDDDDDDYPDWDDDVDETFYNPYMGCDDWDFGGDEW